MLGLVLEGGGQKGAFHAGVVKALYDNGVRFDGVTGTSIGAINALLVAQNDVELCYELWNKMTPSELFGIDDAEMEKLYNKKLDRTSIVYFAKFLKEVWKNRGMSMENIRTFINRYLDEDKVRSSRVDLGFVTVDVSDGFQPIEIFKEDVPYGKLADYVLASAYYPAFKREAIDGKNYLDGGVYDNLPINPLIRRGYDEIIAVRTMSSMPHQRVVDDTVKVHYIEPSDDLGDTLIFTNDALKKNLKLGYFDGLRYLKGYAGKHYYVLNEGEDGFRKFLETVPDSMYEKARTELGLDESSTKESVIKSVIDRVNLNYRLSTELSNYERLVIGMEFFAKRYKLEKFKVYSLREFVSAILRERRKQGEAKSDILKIVSKFSDKNLLMIFSLYLDSLPEVEHDKMGREEVANGNGAAK